MPVILNLKGGAAFSMHVWRRPNTIARCLGCSRIRDIDLDLETHHDYDEFAIVAALCDAVDGLNSHFAPRVLASIRLPTTSHIVHSPPVYTRRWVGPEHVWCHCNRPGPIVAIRRGRCHGNSNDFDLFRIALAVADADGHLHYLPFIDISHHPHPGNTMYSGMWVQPEARRVQPAARRVQPAAQCDAIAQLRVLRSDLRRMLVQESNLRPWLRVDSGKTHARICRLVAVALMLDETHGWSQTLLWELAELEYWIRGVLNLLDLWQCDCRPCGYSTNTAHQIMRLVILLQRVPMRPQHHELDSFEAEERARYEFLEYIQILMSTIVWDLHQRLT